MKITSVKISLMEGQNPSLKAFASITFDDCFVVHDLRIIKNQEKIFVAMPSKKIKDGNRIGDIHKDIAHPIKREMRDLIEKTVLEKYERMKQSFNE